MTGSVMTPIGRAPRTCAGGPPRLAPSVSLLHGFELRVDHAAIELPLSAQRLVAFLALQERPVQRAFVAGTLWTEADGERAGASLRTTLWRTARANDAIVAAKQACLALTADATVDVRDLTVRSQALLRDPLGHRPDDLDVLRDAGVLLPDWYDDWALLARERFRQLRLHALEALCEALMSEGAHAAAAEAGVAAVAAEPLRESAHRVLVRVHLSHGNVGEALRQYRLCRALLRSRLGARPSPTMEQLVAPLRR